VQPSIPVPAQLREAIAPLHLRFGRVEINGNCARAQRASTRIVGPRGPAGDIQAAVDNAEKVAKAIVIERLDSYVQRHEAIAARVRQQVESANGSIRSEFQNIVNSAAVKALRDALENEVAALVLKILVEYQVADIAGDPIKID
jgi:hypothetical protein